MSLQKLKRNLDSLSRDDAGDAAAAEQEQINLTIAVLTYAFFMLAVVLGIVLITSWDCFSGFLKTAFK